MHASLPWTNSRAAGEIAHSICSQLCCLCVLRRGGGGGGCLGHKPPKLHHILGTGFDCLTIELGMMQQIMHVNSHVKLYEGIIGNEHHPLPRQLHL